MLYVDAAYNCRSSLSYTGGLSIWYIRRHWARRPALFVTVRRCHSRQLAASSFSVVSMATLRRRSIISSSSSCFRCRTWHRRRCRRQ